MLMNTAGLINSAFHLNIPANKTYQVFLTAMTPGYWNITSNKGKVSFNVMVSEGKNTIFFKGEPGDYLVSPGKKAGARELQRQDN